jgi:hypothetical protein
MPLKTVIALPGIRKTRDARRCVRRGAGSAVTLLLLAAPSGAGAQARALAAAAMARAGDAVVTIVAYRDGDEVTSGTGVRVADGRVLTALRHLRGASRAEVFGAAGDLLGTLTTLEQADAKLGLGVFPRLGTTGDRVPLARRSVTVTARVNVLGPKKGTVRVNMERTITHVEPDDAGRPIMRLGAPLTASAAGSPVVNARGELVGVAVGALTGRDENDLAIDVSAIRDLLARPPVRLAFPQRDGTMTAAASTAADTRVAAGAVTARPADLPGRTRNSVFPERYGNPIGGDTVGTVAFELFGCAKLESRQKVYCYLRVTNLAREATVTINGGDLADSTNRKLGEAESLITGEVSQRLAGWRSKASIPLKELESVRVAVEFAVPARESAVARLMLDVAGERTLWLGPLVLQRVP